MHPRAFVVRGPKAPGVREFLGLTAPQPVALLPSGQDLVVAAARGLDAEFLEILGSLTLASPSSVPSDLEETVLALAAETALALETLSSRERFRSPIQALERRIHDGIDRWELSVTRVHALA